MAVVSTTGMDLITGALRKINALEAGETPDANAAADAQQVLNDMLEMWSIDHLAVFSSVENILSWTPGQYQYTIGNPTAASPFTGFLVNGSNLITGITNPSSLNIAFGISSGSGAAGTSIPITFSAAPTGTTATILSWTFGAQSGQITFSDGEVRTASITSGGVATWTPMLTGTPTASGNVFQFPASASSNYVGGTLTDVQSAIPSGTTIVSLNTGTTTSITFTGAPTGTTATISGWAGGAVTGLITFSDNETRTATVTVGGVATWSPALTGTPTAAGNQINTTTITMSANATATLTAAESISYTVPGNFAIPRPLKISAAFTRITSPGTTGLDYPIDVDTTQAKYSAIGLKSIPGPWPILLYYNPTFSYGNIYVYPNPQQGGSLHLWTDYQFSDFTSLTQAINLPPAYAMAIKLNLALYLCPEYGKTAGALLVKQAKDALDKIKALNSQPAVQAFYDRDIVRTRRTDAGWILSGGFGN